MKCNIVKDLLPLYIENLCSEESHQEVSEHISICPNCKSDYDKMNMEFETTTQEFINTNNFIEEKDLLSRSKENITDTFKNKLIKNIFIVIFILSFLFNILMFCFTISGYSFRYSKFDFTGFGALQIWGLILPFLPTIISLIGLFVIKKRKLFSRILLGVLLPCIFIGCISTMVFLLFPPICSRTENPSNYMKLDFDTASFQDELELFYPAEIPASATQIRYYYEKHSAIFSDTAMIDCSWCLPAGEYQKMKEAALSLSYFNDSSLSVNNKSGIIISTIALPAQDIKLIFEYDDDLSRVSYQSELSVSH